MATPRFWGVFTVLTLTHLVLRVALGLGDVAPDLLAVALLLGARQVGLARGAGLGLLFGAVEDAFAILAFGANAVAMSVVGALAGATRDLFVGESRGFMVGFLLIGLWVRDLVYWAAAGPLVRGPFVESMVIGGALSAAYATAVGVVALWLAGMWGRTER